MIKIQSDFVKKRQWIVCGQNVTCDLSNVRLILLINNTQSQLDMSMDCDKNSIHTSYVLKFWALDACQNGLEKRYRLRLGYFLESEKHWGISDYDCTIFVHMKQKQVFSNAQSCPKA